jgi:hypothetical protein
VNDEKSLLRVGTHLRNTREAEAFALVSEEAVAKGVRRVIAVTKDEAQAAIKNGQDLESRIGAAGDLKGQDLEKVSDPPYGAFRWSSPGSAFLYRGLARSVWRSLLRAFWVSSLWPLLTALIRALSVRLVLAVSSSSSSNLTNLLEYQGGP